MRIIAGAAAGLRDRDISHGLNSQLRSVASRMLSMSQHCFCNLIADPHNWIEGGHQLLENHGNARATQTAHRVSGQNEEVAPRSVLREPNFSRNPRLWGEKAHDCQRGNWLSGARF